MNSMEAIPIAYRLWKKWVSSRPAVGINGYLRVSHERSEYKAYDLDYIHECILREIRHHRSGQSNASEGLMRETRGELVLLGKVKRALEAH